METWKSIEGLPDAYSVSNEGRIRGSERTHNFYQNGLTRTRTKPAKTYKGSKLSTKGYMRINLCGKVYFWHRIVAIAWIPNPLCRPQVNHKNGVKTDNRIENLEWVTNQQNRDHAVLYGLHPRGETSHAKLTESDVRRIRSMVAIGITQRNIAKQFGIVQQTVCSIVNHKIWRHITE